VRLLKSLGLSALFAGSKLKSSATANLSPITSLQTSLRRPELFSVLVLPWPSAFPGRVLAISSTLPRASEYAKRVDEAFPSVSNLLAEHVKSGQEEIVLQWKSQRRSISYIERLWLRGPATHSRFRQFHSAWRSCDRQRRELVLGTTRDRFSTHFSG
jgi:hypothetical protein